MFELEERKKTCSLLKLNSLDAKTKVTRLTGEPI